MSDQRWGDLVAGYVLDALDADERRDFEARLEQDAALRDEVAAQREVLGALAGGLPARTPPSGLKDRILSEARATRPITSAPSASTRAASAPSATTSEASAGARRLPWFAAAAAVVATVALGISNQQLLDRVDSARARLAEVESVLAATEGEVAARDSLLASLLGPDIRTASLAATGSEPSARLYWNGSTGEVVVTAFSLPPAPEGQVYQLWGIGEGSDPVSLGTFQTTAAGTAVVRATAPEGASFDISAMTQEPVGGSPQPTQTPFLVGSWTGD